jgi:hypothetical protein
MLRERRLDRRGIWRAAVVFIAVSLLVIPVRCDASPYPHSIFVDPPGMDHAEHHVARHAAGDHHTGQGPAVPMKEAPAQSGQPPEIGMGDDGGAGNGGAADPSSLQTGASMIDAPYSISLASVLALLAGDGLRLPRFGTLTGEPHGTALSPPFPPPRSIS